MFATLIGLFFIGVCVLLVGAVKKVASVTTVDAVMFIIIGFVAVGLALELANAVGNALIDIVQSF